MRLPREVIDERESPIIIRARVFQARRPALRRTRLDRRKPDRRAMARRVPFSTTKHSQRLLDAVENDVNQALVETERFRDDDADTCVFGGGVARHARDVCL